VRGIVQNQVEVLSRHIEFLKSLDTEEFYEKDEDEVKQYAQSTLQDLIHLGNQATNGLLGLLGTEFTWSCYFALTILRETKDPQAVPALIAFLGKESDDSMANEEAMFALQDIGDFSIVPLIEALEELFEKKTYNFFLVGALTGIIGPGPYDFMVKITKDFISKPSQYKGWFYIQDFTYNFVKQQRKESISLLKQILEMKGTTSTEKRELEDTIRALEDPEGYENEIQETANELSEATKQDAS
jgi:HEAT repeat protein